MSQADGQDGSETLWTKDEEEAFKKRREKADQDSKKLAEKLLLGWCMMDSYCPKPTCSVPLMRSKDKRLFCVSCEAFVVSEDPGRNNNNNNNSNPSANSEGSPAAASSSSRSATAGAATADKATAAEEKRGRPGNTHKKEGVEKEERKRSRLRGFSGGDADEENEEDDSKSRNAELPVPSSTSPQAMFEAYLQMAHNAPSLFSSAYKQAPPHQPPSPAATSAPSSSPAPSLSSASTQHRSSLPGFTFASPTTSPPSVIPQPTAVLPSLRYSPVSPTSLPSASQQQHQQQPQQETRTTYLDPIAIVDSSLATIYAKMDEARQQLEATPIYATAECQKYLALLHDCSSAIRNLQYLRLITKQQQQQH
ncbi:Metallophosphoesterase [Balamuthia mandrillaris]